MNFAAFKEFKKDLSVTLDMVMNYLSTELTASLRELRAGLQKLTFQDNFESFTEDLTITAGQEVAIRNKIKNAIPSQRLIVKSNEAGLSVCDGDEEWTTDYVFLKNTHATDSAIIRVVFLR